MHLLVESFKSAYKKMTLYRANLISWVIADLSFYTAMYFMYFILTSEIDLIGDYAGSEILLFISCYLLINNLFAVFFSESVSAYCQNIVSGKFSHDLLRPKNPFIYTICKNINLAPLVTTPMLFILNLYCLEVCKAEITAMYLFAIVMAVITMGLLFFTLYTLALFNLKIDSAAGILYQIISISEKPDTVFPNIIRNILIYVIPVYLFSAIPARFALNKTNSLEEVWMFLAPFLLYILLRRLFSLGMKHYAEGLS